MAAWDFIPAKEKKQEDGMDARGTLEPYPARVL